MCRGLGFRLLESYGQPVAIVGTAVAFALAHGAVNDLPWVLVTGLGLGYLRSRSGSLYPCIGLHAFVNGVAVLASRCVGCRRLAGTSSAERGDDRDEIAARVVEDGASLRRGARPR